MLERLRVSSGTPGAAVGALRFTSPLAAATPATPRAEGTLAVPLRLSSATGGAGAETEVLRFTSPSAWLRVTGQQQDAPALVFTTPKQEAPDAPDASADADASRPGPPHPELSPRARRIRDEEVRAGVAPPKASEEKISAWSLRLKAASEARLRKLRAAVKMQARARGWLHRQRRRRQAQRVAERRDAVVRAAVEAARDKGVQGTAAVDVVASEVVAQVRAGQTPTTSLTQCALRHSVLGILGA